MATPAELTQAALALIQDLRPYSVIANQQASPTTEFARTYQQAMAALASAVEAIVNSGGGGGIQALANIGNAAEVFAQTTALGVGQFRTLRAGPNITITPGATELEFSATAATSRPLVVGVGTVPEADYATIDAAIAGFTAGEWGDGINFSIVLLDAGPFSTDWSALPATAECLQIAVCTQAFPAVTFLAPFPGDVTLLGGAGLEVFVDTTHLCERAAESVRVILDGLVSVNAVAAAYDIGRSPSPPFIVVTGDATVLNARFFATDLGGTPSNSFIYTWRGFITCDTTLATSGTGAGAETTILGTGSSIGGSNLNLSGVLLGCTVEQTHRSATDRLHLFGQSQGCTFILNRAAGGTAFNYTLGGAFGVRIEGCEFITGDDGGAVAGAMTVLLGTNTDLLDTILPPRTALGTLGVGATVARNIIRCSCTQLNTVSVAAQRIDGLVLGDVPGNMTLDAPVLVGLRITGTSPLAGLGVSYTIGSSGNRSLVQDLRLEMAAASNYVLTVAGEVLRDITCLNPDPGGGSTHVFGSLSGTFPITQIVENLNVRGTRGGSVTPSIIAVNLVGFIGRLDLAGQTTVDASLLVVHAQKLVISGDLTCEFRPQPPLAAPPLQHGVLDSCEVVGTAAISSAGGGATIIQQISNCLFVGAATLAGGASIDLHLVNTRFVAAPTIGSVAYTRAVVGSSISDVATVISAGTTVVAGSIGIS